MWKTGVVALAFLAGCATSPPPEQIAFFNHGYAIVDVETAAAISESPLVREFMNFEQRTTAANDGQTWTARYLYGRETYFEFFGPGDLGPGMERPDGGTGLALSADRPGGLAAYKARLTAAGVPDIIEGRRTRALGGAQIAWFDLLMPQAVGENVSTMWAMEYVQSYLDNPITNTEPAEGPHDAISRERYHSDTYRERLARDITGIVIAAPAADITEILPLYAAAGFEVARTSGGATAHDSAITISFIEATPEASGLRRLEFALNQPAPTARVSRLGRSTLTIGPGDQAAWVFE